MLQVKQAMLQVKQAMLQVQQAMLHVQQAMLKVQQAMLRETKNKAKLSPAVLELGLSLAKQSRNSFAGNSVFWATIVTNVPQF